MERKRGKRRGRDRERGEERREGERGGGAIPKDAPIHISMFVSSSFLLLWLACTETPLCPVPATGVSPGLLLLLPVSKPPTVVEGVIVVVCGSAAAVVVTAGKRKVRRPVRVRTPISANNIRFCAVMFPKLGPSTRVVFFWFEEKM